MSLLSQLMQESRKAEIGFGVHKNCIITKVSNEVRKNKENVVIKKNSYTKFEMLNDKGESVAEKEISWYNLDFSSDYVFDSFWSQLEQFTGIVDTLIPPTEKKDAWAKEFDKILEENEIELSEGSAEEQKQALKRILEEDKEVFEQVMEHLIKAYEKLVTKAITEEDKVKMRLKITFDPKGKNLQQPRYDSFVESMEVSDEDSQLKVSDKDLEYKSKSLEAAKKPITPAGKI